MVVLPALLPPVTPSRAIAHRREYTAAACWCPEAEMLIARATTGKSDSFGATEKNGIQIEAICICDSLGYRGIGREEHSGENAPLDLNDLSSELADNDVMALLSGDAPEV